MSELDNMLVNQQTKKEPSSNTVKGKDFESQSQNSASLLRKLSAAYKWIGGIAIAIGFIYFIGGLIGAKHESDAPIAIAVGLGTFFSGLFTIFAGCIGEAVDDIRNNIKK